MKKVAIAITLLAIVVGATYGGVAFAGKPVQDSGITPITMDVPMGPNYYEVPSGKNLFITNLYAYSTNYDLKIDDIRVAVGTTFNYQNGPNLAQPIIVGEGQRIWATNDVVTVNGYLQNN